MDPASTRVARRFSAMADTELADNRVSTPHEKAEGEWGQGPEIPVEVRAKAAESDLRRCIDGGEHQWDAIFQALSVIARDELHGDLQAIYAGPLQEATSKVLMALRDVMMVV